MTRSCTSCGEMCKWECLGTGRKGLYNNYPKHKKACIHCSPDRQQRISEEKKADKENRNNNIIQQDRGRLLYSIHPHNTHDALSPVMLINCVWYRCDAVDQDQLPWSDWGQNERALQNGTGLSRGQFDYVYRLCEHALLERRTKMSTASEQTSPLSTRNMLALTLHWFRQHPSFLSLATQYRTFSDTTIINIIHDVVDIMDTYLVPLLLLPIDRSAPSSRRAALPRVKIVIDSTFIPLPKTEKRPQFFHPKSPTKAAMKVEIDCDLRHRIICVSNVVNGSVHDMRLVRQSGTLQQLSDETKAIGDKGYIGQLGIITPRRMRRKVSREVALLQDEKERTHELQSERAAIENINKRVKDWHIMRDVWTLSYDTFDFVDKIVRCVCALVNVILETHPVRAERPPLSGR